MANSITTTLYLVVGLFGYLDFGKDVEGNILNSYSPSDYLAMAGRLSMALHVR